MRTLKGALLGISLFAAPVVAALAGAVPAAAAQPGSDTPQALVDAATRTVIEMSADPNYKDIAGYVARAKAVMVVPQLIKAGLIVGGEAGEAVVLSRTPDGGWSAPAFYSLAGGSIGLQAGVETRQVVIAVMTDNGLTKLLGNQFELGVDASISVGTVGGGAGASSVGSVKADMVSFSRSKGLFGGGALDGGLIRPDTARNAAYYGASTTTRTILVERTADNPGAAGLKAALLAH